MVSRNSGIRAEKIAKRTISAIAVLGLLALGGCSSSTPATPADAAMEKTELHFNLDQCQPLGENMYKCPAIDKPVCNPNFHSDSGVLNCVKIGPKGSIFVQNGLVR